MSDIVRTMLLGGMMGAAGCIFVVPEDVLLPGGQDWRDTASEDFAAGLDDLTLIVPAGDITVTPAATGEVGGLDVVLEWRGDEADAPTLQVDTVGDAVVYEWTCPLRARRCRVDLDVTVPDTLGSLTVELDAGNLNTSALVGLLDIGVDAGDVTIRGHDGTLRLQVDAGNVDGTDLCLDTADVTVDAGNVGLALCDRPDAVTVDVDTGNVGLELPAGAYDLHTRVSVGRTSVDRDITHDPGADSAISVEVDVGNVDITAF